MRELAVLFDRLGMMFPESCVLTFGVPFSVCRDGDMHAAEQVDIIKVDE